MTSTKSHTPGSLIHNHHGLTPKQHGGCSTCRFWNGGKFKQINKSRNKHCLHPCGHKFTIVPSERCHAWEPDTFGKTNDKNARTHYWLTDDYTGWTFKEPHSYND